MRRLVTAGVVVSVGLLGLIVAAASQGVPGGPARAPVDAAPVVDLNRILLWMYAVIVIIALLTWRGQERGGEKKLAKNSWAGVLLLLALFALLVIFSEDIGEFMERLEPPVVEDFAQEPFVPEGEPADDLIVDGAEAPGLGSPSWLLIVVLAAAVGLLLMVLRPTARRPEEEIHGPSTEPLLEPPGDAESDQVLALSGSPRHRVLAAYRQFESRVTAAGWARADWETPMVHARRVAGESGLDKRDVTDLAKLYYRARFSQGVIGEEEAARADRLRSLLASKLERA